MARNFHCLQHKRFAQSLFKLALVLAIPNAGAVPLSFDSVNLVTDDQTAHAASITDPNLKNAWGVSFSATSPFWVSDNGTGKATLYTVNPLTDATTQGALIVTIPGAGNPTGQVFNPTSAFNADRFLFVSEDGTVSGWRGALGTNAEVLATADPANVYKGAAFAMIGGNSYLYAANFGTNKIDVFPSSGAPSLSGSFTDPGIPSGFAPFNIRNLNGILYVTYAKTNGSGDDVAGTGNGFVSAFDLNGNFLGRIGSQGALNSPWGLEIAPASFDELAGDLLVGNFGDGTVNVFDPVAHAFLGQLSAIGGGALQIGGLWALTVGNDGNAGSSDKLYFSAGPDDEAHGLFGVLHAQPGSGLFQPGSGTVPEPGTLPLSAAGLLAAWALQRQSKFGAANA
ncbi:MAG TPA: TIGR03118 family protein [Thiobacillaceae bacterium]|nr:TIGR03118 family protein [Thiobacillaceae bacterium]